MENGEGQFSGLVEDRDGSLGIFADSDLGMAQGITGRLGLDLVDDLPELEGEVFGEQSGLLPGQDVAQLLTRGERAVDIVRTARRDRKSGIKSRP